MHGPMPAARADDSEPRRNWDAAKRDSSPSPGAYVQSGGPVTARETRHLQVSSRLWLAMNRVSPVLCPPRTASSLPRTSQPPAQPSLQAPALVWPTRVADRWSSPPVQLVPPLLAMRSAHQQVSRAWWN